MFQITFMQLNRRTFAKQGSLPRRLALYAELQIKHVTNLGSAVFKSAHMEETVTPECAKSDLEKTQSSPCTPDYGANMEEASVKDRQASAGIVTSEITPPHGMSKRAMKRILRNQLLKERKKNEPKPLTKNQDPGFSAELFKETEYYFENGLRKVYPYFFTFKTFAKHRWVGKKVLDVLQSEFRSEEPETYEKAVTDGRLTINGKTVKVDYKLRHNDFLAHTIHRHENPVTGMPIEIIADTEEVVVINKPASIPCHPCGRYRHNTIPFILGKEYGYSNLRNIYRLDRLTSGVLICAKTAEKTRELEDQIASKQVCKEYVCRVVGRFPDGEVICEQPLAPFCHKISLWQVKQNGRASKTSFQRLSYNGHTSVVKCFPFTGRTHQIRVHLQYLGHPIVNDPFYNSAAFGPNRGKGGNYGRPEEEIIEEILKSHNTGMWVEGKNPFYHQRLQELKAVSSEVHSEQDGAKDCGKTDVNAHQGISEEKTNHSKITNLSDDVKNGAGSLDNDEGIVEPVPKKLKSDKNSEVLQSVVKHGRAVFDVANWIPDENCEYCRNKFIDPKPEDLVLYLHALSYKGPDWEYSTSLPDWAKDDWINNAR